MKTSLLFVAFFINGYLPAVCKPWLKDTLLKNVETFRLKSIAFQPIWYTTYNNQGGFSDFQQIQLKNNLDKNNLDGFTQSYNYTSNLTMGINFKAILNLNKTNSKDVALDMTFFSAGILSAQYFKDSQGGVDTLYNSSGNIKLITDTTVTNIYEINYSANFAQLNAAYRFKTDPTKRWVFYGGLGLGLGYSFISRITTRKNEITNVRDRVTNNNTGVTNEDYFTSYAWERCKNSITASLGLPMGVEFRLGDNINFFKRTHLFFECKTGISLFYIPKSFFKPLLTVQNGLGLKIDLF